MLFAEPMLFCMLLTGTGYMRSTNKAIAALKATFQTPVYPLLDQVRSALGAKIDQELAHLKVLRPHTSGPPIHPPPLHTPQDALTACTPQGNVADQTAIRQA